MLRKKGNQDVYEEVNEKNDKKLKPRQQFNMLDTQMLTVVMEIAKKQKERNS